MMQQASSKNASWINQALETVTQSMEGKKPGDDTLDNPAGYAQTAAVRLAAPCHFSCNAGSVYRTAVFVVIVASVTLNYLRFREWSAAFAADLRDGINQCMELGDIVPIDARQDHCERNALRFGNKVVL